MTALLADKCAHVITTVVAALLITGCAAFKDQNTSSEYTVSDCTRIDPQAATTAPNPCFFATRPGPGSVELHWKVVNSEPQVYIYDDLGPHYHDPGWQSATCTQKQQNTCSTTITLNEGGHYRWVLMAQHASGTKVHVPLAIDVEPLHPAREVNGGGLLNSFAVVDQRLTWTADQSNAPLDYPETKAWVEIHAGGDSRHRGNKPRRPRSGPAAELAIPATKLEQKERHQYEVIDCISAPPGGTRFCSPPLAAGFIIRADRFLAANPLYTRSGEQLELEFTTNSGAFRRLESATLLPEGAVTTGNRSVSINGQRLTPGMHQIQLASCDDPTLHCVWGHTLTILVDQPVRWELARDYRRDFQAAAAFSGFSGGGPLDIDYDAHGGIWMISEFANSVEHVSPYGETISINLPLARRHDPISGSSTPVRPFATSVVAKRLMPATFSALAERITVSGDKVWFTQGGGMLAEGAQKIDNYSRVFSFDINGINLPETAYDDRLCAYNVPADDATGAINNQVIGLDALGERIWFAESRGLFGNGPSVISSFIPSADMCENLFGFGQQETSEPMRLRSCGAHETPEQHGCLQRLSLAELPPGLKVAHLAADAQDATIWFTDLRGRFLGHLDPRRNTAITLYRIPKPLIDPATQFIDLRDFPWSIRVSDDAVYFGEYLTSQLVRFDKRNQQFHDINVPVSAPGVKLHSIDIDAATDRLWFTLGDERRVVIDPKASTVGFVDLASWRRYLAQPDAGHTINGVVYGGLDRIPASPLHPGFHQAFRGIAVDPASGNVALATMRRNQVTELVPRAEFRAPLPAGRQPESQ